MCMTQNCLSSDMKKFLKLSCNIYSFYVHASFFEILYFIWKDSR